MHNFVEIGLDAFRQAEWSLIRQTILENAPRRKVGFDRECSGHRPGGDIPTSAAAALTNTAPPVTDHAIHNMPRPVGARRCALPVRQRAVSRDTVDCEPSRKAGRSICLLRPFCCNRSSAAAINRDQIQRPEVVIRSVLQILRLSHRFKSLPV